MRAVNIEEVDSEPERTPARRYIQVPQREPFRMYETPGRRLSISPCTEERAIPALPGMYDEHVEFTPVRTRCKMIRRPIRDGDRQHPPLSSIPEGWG